MDSYGYIEVVGLVPAIAAAVLVVVVRNGLGLRFVLAYILSVPLKAPGIWVAIVNHKNLKEI